MRSIWIRRTTSGSALLTCLPAHYEESWGQIDRAMVARIDYQGKAVYLVKPLGMINSSGPSVLHLGSQLGFGPAECVLVHDDINLPLGTVRMRVRRSTDGGHRGVRSILQAFQTDEMRRVKIGVDQGKTDQVSDYVLTPFSQDALSTIEKSLCGGCGPSSKDDCVLSGRVRYGCIS